MKTLAVCILALGCLATAPTLAQTVSPATAPPAAAPPPQPAPPAAVATPEPPDYVAIAKGLVATKKYQDMVELVSEMSAQITGLAHSNDALYQKTLALNLQMANMQQAEVKDDANRVLEQKRAVDANRANVIRAMEVSNPGMMWDEQQGKLIPRPAPATAPAKGTPDAAVKK